MCFHYSVYRVLGTYLELKQYDVEGTKLHHLVIADGDRPASWHHNKYPVRFFGGYAMQTCTLFHATSLHAICATGVCQSELACPPYFSALVLYLPF
jgi:hypothetical protein